MRFLSIEKVENDLVSMKDPVQLKVVLKECVKAEDRFFLFILGGLYFR